MTAGELVEKLQRYDAGTQVGVYSADRAGLSGISRVDDIWFCFECPPRVVVVLVESPTSE